MSSDSHASSAGAATRPWCTCTWAAPIHGSPGHTTARLSKKQSDTSRPGIRGCGLPRGAPPAPNRRRLSALGWCPRWKEHSSARLHATTRRGEPPCTSSPSTCSGRGTLRGSSATTGWSNSSAHLTARRPGCTDASRRAPSIRDKGTAPAKAVVADSDLHQPVG